MLGYIFIIINSRSQSCSQLSPRATLTLLPYSPNFPRATPYTHATHETIFKCMHGCLYIRLRVQLIYSNRAFYKICFLAVIERNMMTPSNIVTFPVSPFLSFLSTNATTVLLVVMHLAECGLFLSSPGVYTYPLSPPVRFLLLKIWFLNQTLFAFSKINHPETVKRFHA